MSPIRKIPINTPGAGGEASPAPTAPTRSHGQGPTYGQGPSERGETPGPPQGSRQHGPTGDETSRGTSAEGTQDKVFGSFGKERGAHPRPAAAGHKASPGHEPPTPGAEPSTAETPRAEDAAPEPVSAAQAALPEEGLATELEAVAGERDALNDDLLRLRAEFDNYRRRSARDLADSHARAQAELLNDLLPVLDNLERALDAAEHHDETKVLGGVRMTRDMFVDLLRRVGVEEVETEGAPFDPAVHEAIVMQPSAEHPEGSVAAVLQRGYRQGDHILRPARVVVSSGPGDADDGRAAE